MTFWLFLLNIISSQRSHTRVQIRRVCRPSHWHNSNNFQYRSFSCRRMTLYVILLRHHTQGHHVCAHLLPRSDRSRFRIFLCLFIKYAFTQSMLALARGRRRRYLCDVLLRDVSSWNTRKQGFAVLYVDADLALTCSRKKFPSARECQRGALALHLDCIDHMFCERTS
ncbi:hypothetical protein B0O99DRAFT_609169 [Bisporella sp. PMI_857]|nr:hypothetical protein B0O99DRAFT_609169 [Bisporella sp. PMI_857]